MLRHARGLASAARVGQALIFPGQGTQTVGMGRDFYDKFSYCRALTEEFDDVLGYKLSKLMFEGPEETLTRTDNAQPAILLHSLLVLEALKRERGLDVDTFSYALGHSLGEYTALVAAGSISARDAARLVRIRGTAMQSAMDGRFTAATTPQERRQYGGAMAALFPCDAATATQIAAEAAAADARGVCEVANVNSPTQVVIAGTRGSVENGVAIGKKKFKVKRGTMLNVSAPFHTSLMTPAATAVATALASVRIAPPRLPVVLNATASPTINPVEIREGIVRQVTSTVQWCQSVLLCRDNGVRKLIELGPGNVLSSLAKKTDDALEATSFSTVTSISAAATIA